MRNRDITETIFPLAPFFLKLHFTPLFPTLPPPPCILSSAEGWICGQFIRLHRCHSFLPTCFSCSTMGFHPTGQSIRLLQHRSSPQGRVLKQQTVEHGFPVGCSFCQKNRFRVGFSLWAAVSARSLLQCGFSMGCRMGICSTTDLHRLKGDSQPHHGLPHELQRNLCSHA